MADPKKWNDPIFPEIDFADILDSEEAGLANDAGSQKVWKKGTLTSYLSTLYQALNANLTELAALAFANNKLLYIDGSGNLALADLTAAGRALLDDVNAAAQRTTLDVDSSSEVDSKIDADVATHSADTTGIHGITDTAQLATLNTAQTFTAKKFFGDMEIGYGSSFQPLFISRYSTNAFAQGMRFYKSRGTPEAPTAVVNGDQLARIMASATSSAGITGAGGNDDFIVVVATENWTGTAQGKRVYFQNTPNGTVTAVRVLELKENDIDIVVGALTMATNTVITSERHFQLRFYPTGSLPSAAGREGQMVYDSTTKKSLTSDGTAWQAHY